MFVIQHGTVSLWDESASPAALTDVRGAGDMLGLERFTGAPCCVHTARSATDVLIYAFPETDFTALVLESPEARQFIETAAAVTTDASSRSGPRGLDRMSVGDMVGRHEAEYCGANTTIAQAAALLRDVGTPIPVVDDRGTLQTLVTVDAILSWVADGAGDTEQPIGALPGHSLPAIGPTTSVVEAAIVLGDTDAEALAVTENASPGGRFLRLVTLRDIGRAFGDQPVTILRDMRRATTTHALGELNRRARSLALGQLTSPISLDWIARYLTLADAYCVERLIAITGGERAAACWCTSGAAGRGESLTAHAPGLVLISADSAERSDLTAQFESVADGLLECGYALRSETSFDRQFLVATSSEWQARYREWMHDPVRTRMYLARPLFDLRPVHGERSLWQQVDAAITSGVSRDFMHLLANDCLASVPPLTFFENAVIDEAGEQAPVFRLEHSALRPLVDVGRVLGMAAKRVPGLSTRDRFAIAQTRLPANGELFREAGETARILLWHQARVGIGHGTDGSEFSPALLGRYDRNVLKNGFRSIRRLLEFVGDLSWLASIA